MASIGPARLRGPPGERAAQHANVIEAATEAGVELLGYTSVTTPIPPRGPRPGTPATEQLLAASGLPVVLLRNSWYIENWTGRSPVRSSTASRRRRRRGRVSAATRADYAAAAAAVLVAEDQAGRVYELGGDTAFTLAEYAATLSAESSTEVAYRDLSAAELTSALVGAGLPEPYAALLADSDLGIARGELRPTPATWPGSSVGPRRRRVKRSAPHWPERSPSGRGGG